ncbi:hypothetical protein TSMEX_003556, partial [Taenia solium]
IFKLLQFTVSILALAYLQALMSYYERQFRNCETRLKEDKTLNESGRNAAQDETINFKREESQVDFIEVDNSAGELNNRFECKHSEEIKHEHPSDILGTKQNLPCRIKMAVFENTSGTNSGEAPYHANRSEASKLLVKRGIVAIGRMFGDSVNIDRKNNPPFIKSEKGNSLYLRLGAVVYFGRNRLQQNIH